MRLTLIFTLCCVVLSMATATDVLSQKKKETDINLSLTNASVVSVIETISRETGYKFVYDEAYLSQMERIAIRLKDATLQEALQQVSNQTGLVFRKVEDIYTVIRAVEPARAEKTEAKVRQGIRITGTVSDNFGELMPGVSVVLRGSTVGTSTDGNGEFTVFVPSDTSVLQFRFLGYRMQEVIVGARRIIAVTLQEQITDMEEVVVVAFGKQKKTDLIGSVTTIRSSDLRAPTSNLTTMLAGQAAGIISYQRTGEPGEDNANFFIRGITSFGVGKVDPLILIDGIELGTTELARLRPDDIESFSIFKAL